MHTHTHAHMHEHTHKYTHTQLPADGEVLEYIHANGFAYMQILAQTHNHTVVSVLLIFLTAVASYTYKSS